MKKDAVIKGIKGYKVFNSDWTCNPVGKPFQYIVGESYEEDVILSVCNSGFHFCKIAVDCFNYYSFNPNNKVAEIIAYGYVIEKGDKCYTNKIKIVREITWEELLTIVNIGNRNTGDRNTGNRNTGNRNTGSCNTGNWNTGNWNSGDWNTGSWNTGNWNTGNWNKASNVVGCFNTENQKLKFFDKETDMTFEQWQNSNARYLLNQIDFNHVEWIWSKDMSNEEMDAHPEYKTTGSYLKNRNNSDCCKKWWNELPEINKNIIKNIPNFNADKFLKITGIQV